MAPQEEVKMKKKTNRIGLKSILLKRNRSSPKDVRQYLRFHQYWVNIRTDLILKNKREKIRTKRYQRINKK